jgi:hypothetical protein
MVEMKVLKKFIHWGDKRLKTDPHKFLTFGEAIDKAEELYRELKKNQKNPARVKNPKSKKTL